MAKKFRNKQAELAKKMEIAKKQKAEKEGLDQEPTKAVKLSDKEIKEQNDRLRFDELLKSQSVSMNSISSDSYLNKQQEEEDIDAYRKYPCCRGFWALYSTYWICMISVFLCMWNTGQDVA